MGWDAFANIERDWDKKIVKVSAINKEFKKASKYVQKKTGAVDWLLTMGGLDVSTCGNMLERATNESVYKDWDAELVQKLNKSAYWGFEYDKAESWAYYSAKKFLEICAKFDLSIRFSY